MPNINTSTHTISVTAANGHSGLTESVAAGIQAVTDWWRFNGTIDAGGTDTYTAANIPNMSNAPLFIHFFNHDAVTTATVTITMGVGSNAFTIPAGGSFTLHGQLSSTLTSIDVAGTAGDLYTLIIGD